MKKHWNISKDFNDQFDSISKITAAESRVLKSALRWYDMAHNGGWSAFCDAVRSLDRATKRLAALKEKK